MKAKSWYSISAKAEIKTTEISIFDEIGVWGITAKQFISDLKKIPSNHKINLSIHSPGGEVFDGNVIATALKRHAGGVSVQIEGLAASMATVIALSGSPIRMSENGFFMIHNPWSFTLGDADSMRKQADLLDKIQTGIVSAYAEKSGQSIAQIEQWMDAETWFTAQEAKDAGFVDEITDAHQMAASINKFPRMEKFKNAPQSREILDNNSKVIATVYYDKPPSDLTAGEIVMEEISPTPEPIEETPAVVVEETPIEETPAETPEAPVEEVPETPVAVIANAESITAKFNAISAERDAFKALADTYKAKLDANELALDRLERSLGVAAAKVVPAVEPEPSTTPDISALTGYDKVRAAFSKTK